MHSTNDATDRLRAAMATRLHPAVPSRREVLAAGGGLFVTSLLRLAPSRAAAAEDSKDLIFRTTEPRNGEPALGKLVQTWITPTRHFYVRSHAANPQVDLGAYQLRVEGLVRRPLRLTLNQLAEFPRQRVTATLTCAGNRRTEFFSEGRIDGVAWQAGAIGNATWEGCDLADVLRRAEVLEAARHVWFEGLDQIPKDDRIIPFGGSIPIEKAMQKGAVPGALLVDRMNGAPLTADHGFPLRTVVPGYIGARSVKWLGRIVVSDRPSPNYYVAKAYKIVRESGAIDWAESGPLYRYPINAAIGLPAAETAVEPGQLELKGYALPAGRPGTTIDRVMISADGGQSWKRAELLGSGSEFCWQLWQGRVRVSPRTGQIIVRAFDTSGGFMPRRVPWNARGYLQNSWYRLPIQAGSLR